MIQMDEIHIPESRQRKLIAEKDIDLLAASIRARGLINPILVCPREPAGFTLICGHRRLLASAKIFGGDAPILAHVTTAEDLGEHEVLELEENTVRKDLSWQELCNAILKIHERRVASDSSWSIEDTGEVLNMGHSTAWKYIAVGRALVEGHDLVPKASGLEAAVRILTAEKERQKVELKSQVAVDLKRMFSGEPKEVEESSEEPKAEDTDWLPEVPYLVFVEDSKTLSDGFPLELKYNLLHCDFPYGIGHNKSALGASGDYVQYDDSVENFQALMRGLHDGIGDVLDLSSAHLIFWFSMIRYEEVFSALQALPGRPVVNPFPFIWNKSGVAMHVDTRRQPSRAYETALIATFGDRPLVRGGMNIYSCRPSTDKDHQSEKALPMLEYLLSMFVDKTTRMFDPTCGSGTALRAALALGAQHVVGWDINEANVAIAKLRLDEYWELQQAAGEKIKGEG